ncbi:MAG: bifunctional hydroxymethylpyrimidine kinase/phosphomethylpyrimidine kinase [Candidatus Thermoplasmatota archaeon]|nr:bifunctional hydroxymethylpyrimidine kinase/phosphomethylpyrimidine kinase [Candidatus Thermoplasmatota archaeon]
MKKKIALSIAGSDSSAGAGIQADLKSFTYLGVHGLTVITCVTAQNTQQVKAIYTVPVDIIEQQLETLFLDFHITAVKTGMLYDEDIITQVVKIIRKKKINPVVDPVMVSTSGDILTHNSFLKTMKKELLPHALMVTANIPEAIALASMNICNQNDIEDSCRKIFKLGPKYVLVKGGHTQSDMVTDTLYDGTHFHRFTLPRIPKRKAHGSGCTLSALITGLLALGEKPVIAVQKAQSIVWSMIQEGYSPGNGADVLNHTSSIQTPPLVTNNEQFQTWLQLKNAVQTLISLTPTSLIPQVGMNFAYGLPGATSQDDICAINGRITRQKNKAALCGTLEFGASKHVAAIILAALSFDSSKRSALNIRYSPEIVQHCTDIGLTCGSFDRKFEPPMATSTMEWGTKQAITACGFVPDIIYDIGSEGKEPMIRIIGKNPEDVLNKIKKVINL